MTITKEDLRKVKWNATEDGSGDYQANGYFHKWIKEDFNDAGTWYTKNYALIESDETGKVYRVYPPAFKFVDSF